MGTLRIGFQIGESRIGLGFIPIWGPTLHHSSLTEMTSFGTQMRSGTTKRRTTLARPQTKTHANFTHNILYQ